MDKESRILSNLLIELTGEIISTSVIQEFLKNRIPDENVERNAYTIVQMFDKLLLVAANKDSGHLKKSILRNMLHSSFHEIRSNNPLLLTVCRLIHHFVTIYASRLIKDTELIRNIIQPIELCNLLSGLIHMNHHYNKQNELVRVKLVEIRFYGQVASRLYFLLHTIRYFRNEDVDSSKLSIKIMAIVLNMISLQEVAHAYVCYDKTRTKKEKND